jgi:hypothetical protein
MASMLETQASVNDRLNPGWREKNDDYMKAYRTELYEASLHDDGWKWWAKAKPTDMDEVLVELVDAWHFLLSQFLRFPQTREDTTIDGLADNLANLYEVGVGHRATWILDGEITFAKVIDETIRRSFSVQSSAARFFFTMLDYLKIDIETLYTFYRGKALLNSFRQDFGYKQGTYLKIWADGREDNTTLISILRAMGPIPMDDSTEYLMSVRESLETTYKYTLEHVNAASA